MQRLGYLLEEVIGETEKADELLEMSKAQNQHFRKTALKPGKKASGAVEVNKKWKVIVNQQIEIDEL